MTEPKKSCQCHDYHRPDVDSTEAVWVDPSSYDYRQHGPPYMTASERDDIRKTASKLSPRLAAIVEDIDVTPLTTVLVVLLAANQVHYSHHWMTHGPSYYGDHLLFQRLFEESADVWDGVAERYLGLGGRREYLSPVDLTAGVAQVCRRVCTYYPNDPTPIQMAKCGLDMEYIVLSVLKTVYQTMEKSGALSGGTDDLLQAAMNKHEEFVYLLRQRVQQA